MRSRRPVAGICSSCCAKVQIRWLASTVSRRSQHPGARLSGIWNPIGHVSAAMEETGHDKLIRAGFLRQSQSGIFQLLPMGLRVQNKIENLLDKHMQSLGASKVSLSTITSEDLWKKSGRLDKVSPELFRFKDRKNTGLMLSPTHEEEITSLVASTVRSYKELPLRLYQMTRKYRDEIRPRHGLLRSREFLMKDLYTFDISSEAALETYEAVSAAYRAFFGDLKISVVAAEASSGDMGGKHSHEYHLPHPIGADTLVTCDSCTYAANDEVAQGRLTPLENPKETKFHVWRGITRNRQTFVNAWYPALDNRPQREALNIHAVKKLVPHLDTTIRDSTGLWKKCLEKREPAITRGDWKPRVLNVVDARLVESFQSVRDHLPIWPEDMPAVEYEDEIRVENDDGSGLDLLQLSEGQPCPRCDSGKLKIQRALELGHTFRLGTRYSSVLNATITVTGNPKDAVPMEMGCHGIGVSRILGSIAEHMSDEKGLRWPRAIAPYEVIVVPSRKPDADVSDFYDNKIVPNLAGTDMILDDSGRPFGRKMADADLIGYPVVVVLGKTWSEDGRTCEVQSRGLGGGGVSEQVDVDDLPAFIKGVLANM